MLLGGKKAVKTLHQRRVATFGFAFN